MEEKKAKFAIGAIVKHKIHPFEVLFLMLILPFQILKNGGIQFHKIIDPKRSTILPPPG